MNVQKVPAAWEQVLVRHVVKAKWGDVDRISSLLTAPFDRNSSTSCDGGGSTDIPLSFQPSGRWMFAARFAGVPWIMLFSNAAAGERLFEVHADSRRLEVAWIGCQSDDRGWFFRVQRGGKLAVEFSQGIDADAPTALECKDVDLGKGGGTGEQVFGQLCKHYGIVLPMPQIRVVDDAFQIIGKRGKPVKTGLRGYHIEYGPEIAAGENKAATALARAIDHCDAEGIRKAVQRGASLKALPDTSVSPLMSALYKCDRPGGEECVRTLVELGCSIDGTGRGRSHGCELRSPLRERRPGSEDAPDNRAAGSRRECGKLQVGRHGLVRRRRLPAFRPGPFPAGTRRRPDDQEPAGAVADRLAAIAGRGGVAVQSPRPSLRSS